jgi:hypothetical protein
MTNEHLSPDSEDAIRVADVDAHASCCSTEEKATCCEPEEKSGCCGAQKTASGGCGCR